MLSTPTTAGDRFMQLQAARSCDPAVGHALAPGTYDVRVVVPVARASEPLVGLVSVPAVLVVTS